MDTDALIYLATRPQNTAAASQLDQLVRSLCEIEQNNLTGIYLHGSVAMRCFQPGRSDLDLLVLLDHPPEPQRRRRWAELLLHLSGAPAPIEISFLHRSQYNPWCYPPAYDFHFSEEWRARTQEQVAAGAQSAWAGAEGADVDLAAHFTVARRRGLRLYGEPLDSALPHVPWAHYWDSISRDIVWAYGRAADNPVYLVLNCCRVWAAAAEQLVLSKAEGAVWAIPRLPAASAPVVALAAALYAGQTGAQTGAQAGAQDRTMLGAASVLETVRWMCAQMDLALEEPPAVEG